MSKRETTCSKACPIAEVARRYGMWLHVDAAQATGKVAIDLKTLPVDLMSLASHKTYGPKGIGALYVRRKPRVRIEAQMHGGGHERGMRSGTLPTHQIVGMGEAFRLNQLNYDHIPDTADELRVAPAEALRQRADLRVWYARRVLSAQRIQREAGRRT